MTTGWFALLDAGRLRRHVKSIAGPGTPCAAAVNAIAGANASAGVNGLTGTNVVVGRHS